jgi:hypothetical protein
MARTAGDRQMPQKPDYSTHMIYVVILAGIAIRVFSAANTQVINPDGMVYIQQAKAIFHGDWQGLRSCLPFVSNYPFFVAAAYGVFASWIDSARCISVFFGSLTLVPLYFLLRCFTDIRTACLSVLLYGFMPFLVGGSVDLIRDPVCWFFTVSALLLFVKQMGSQGPFWKRFCYLASSYILFLMAGWARPEAFMALIVSCLFSLLHSLSSRDKRYVLASIASLLLLGFFVTAGTMIFDPSLNLYSTSASGKLSASIEQYRNLRQQLEILTEGLSRGVLASFLSKVRPLVWLVDLGVLIGNSVAGVFYPYIVFFVVGFFGLSARLRKDPRVTYLLILVILGYVLLFVHVLQIWYVEHRFLHVIVFPACIFAAFGIERITHLIADKLGWKSSTAAIMIFLYLIAFGLGKNIKKRDEDKVVYLQIAEYISELEKPGHTFIPVMTADASSLRLVPFYLNLHLPTGFCPLQTPPAITDNSALVRYVKDNDVKYFLWDEKNWQRTRVDIYSEDFRQNFNCLERWYHKDYGDIVLFCRGPVVGN